VVQVGVEVEGRITEVVIVTEWVIEVALLVVPGVGIAAVRQMGK